MGMLFLWSNYAPGKEKHFFVFIIQNTFIYKPYSQAQSEHTVKQCFAQFNWQNIDLGCDPVSVLHKSVESVFIVCSKNLLLKIDVDTWRVSGMEMYLGGVFLPMGSNKLHALLNSAWTG